MKKSLESMPGRLIAMLDACHSGEVASQKLLATADDLVRDLVTEDYGVIVMSSSLGTEYSLESPKTKHGFFTFGLVNGLKGRADSNKDNFVYLTKPRPTLNPLSSSYLKEDRIQLQAAHREFGHFRCPVLEQKSSVRFDLRNLF